MHFAYLNFYIKQKYAWNRNDRQNIYIEIDMDTVACFDHLILFKKGLLVADKLVWPTLKINAIQTIQTVKDVK